METSSLYGKEDNEGVLNEQTSGSCFSLICMYTHIQLHSGSFSFAMYVLLSSSKVIVTL